MSSHFSNCQYRTSPSSCSCYRAINLKSRKRTKAFQKALHAKYKKSYLKLEDNRDRLERLKKEILDWAEEREMGGY